MKREVQRSRGQARRPRTGAPQEVNIVLIWSLDPAYEAGLAGDLSVRG